MTVIETLQTFLLDPHNSKTKERIFYNKLYFDLKMAAARCGYPLSLFEPEVDRDGFDIVLDDGDNERRVQLKTVLGSAATATWKSTNRFMRPDPEAGDAIGQAPADCGLGGGFILIDINHQNPEGAVRYSYTDWFIISALHMRMFIERTPAISTPGARGRRRQSRYDFAKRFLIKLQKGDPHDSITLQRQLFFRVNSPDALLAILGMHSTLPPYLPSNGVLQAYNAGFQGGDTGSPEKRVTREAMKIASSHAIELLTLLDEPDLMTFNLPPLMVNEA